MFVSIINNRFPVAVYGMAEVPEDRAMHALQTMSNQQRVEFYKEFFEERRENLRVTRMRKMMEERELEVLRQRKMKERKHIMGELRKGDDQR